MKYLYLSLGWFLFILGLIGFVLPILPSVPFMAGAAYFFSKGSRRIHDWLLNLPYFGTAIKEWDEKRILRADLKCALSITVIFMTIYSFIFIKLHFVAGLSVCILALCALILIWKSPSERS